MFRALRTTTARTASRFCRRPSPTSFCTSPRRRTARCGASWSSVFWPQTWRITSVSRTSSPKSWLRDSAWPTRPTARCCAPSSSCAATSQTKCGQHLSHASGPSALRSSSPCRSSWSARRDSLSHPSWTRYRPRSPSRRSASFPASCCRSGARRTGCSPRSPTMSEGSRPRLSTGRPRRRARTEAVARSACRTETVATGAEVEGVATAAVD
eukprot:Amastigsp_a10941_40.p2 type:complete len:211 gc:universal Amastigsp_a10941_40:457-1089(+)